MPQPSAYARRQNRLRQRHPDVVDFRLGEATRYETYERHLLARNYNASATPRYMQHFDEPPHKIHMVAACIEQVTRAVEDIQQQQLARYDASPSTTTSGKNYTNNDNNQNHQTSFSLEQNMQGIGVPIGGGGGGTNGSRLAPGSSSSSSRFRGPSTTAKLFLPPGAESIGETLNPDYQHHMKNEDNADDGDDGDDAEVDQEGEAIRKKLATGAITAAEIVLGTKKHNRQAGRSPSPQVPGDHNNKEKAEGQQQHNDRKKSPSTTSHHALRSGSPPKAAPSGSTSGFFSGFDDPTRKFRFKPVELAEALTDPPVHPFPRPPLFSRPCKGQTVVVGGDIRLVGKSLNSSIDPLSEPKVAAQAAVARDPKMLAVRIAVEQNPLHEAIEQMRQVTAAMAVKTYNAVNTMNTILKLAERDEKELQEKQQQQQQTTTLPGILQQRSNEMGSLVSSARNNTKNNRNSNSPISGRSDFSNQNNLANLARGGGKRLRDPQFLSRNYRQQQQQQQQQLLASKPSPNSARPISTFSLAQKQKQQEQLVSARAKLNTPQRQRAIEDLEIHQGKHLGDETIIASKPPTRENRAVPNNHSPGSIRPLVDPNSNAGSNHKFATAEFSPEKNKNFEPVHAPPLGSSQAEHQHQHQHEHHSENKKSTPSRPSSSSTKNAAHETSSSSPSSAVKAKKHSLIPSPPKNSQVAAKPPHPHNHTAKKVEDHEQHHGKKDHEEAHKSTEKHPISHNKKDKHHDNHHDKKHDKHHDEEEVAQSETTTTAAAETKPVVEEPVDGDDANKNINNGENDQNNGNVETEQEPQEQEHHHQHYEGEAEVTEVTNDEEQQEVVDHVEVHDGNQDVVNENEEESHQEHELDEEQTQIHVEEPSE